MERLCFPRRDLLARVVRCIGERRLGARERRIPLLLILNVFKVFAEVIDNLLLRILRQVFHHFDDCSDGRGRHVNLLQSDDGLQS